MWFVRIRTAEKENTRSSGTGSNFGAGSAGTAASTYAQKTEQNFPPAYYSVRKMRYNSMQSMICSRLPVMQGRDPDPDPVGGPPGSKLLEMKDSTLSKTFTSQHTKET
jgi:hypothetical protein